MRLYFKNKTAFTSEDYKIGQPGGVDAVLLISGAGTVALAFQTPEGSWISYPESSFEGPTAKRIRLPEGQVRVEITAGSPINVELQY